jgi:hypothetical protein
VAQSARPKACGHRVPSTEPTRDVGEVWLTVEEGMRQPTPPSRREFALEMPDLTVEEPVTFGPSVLSRTNALCVHAAHVRPRK